MDISLPILEIIVGILGVILAVVLPYVGVYAGKYYKNSNLRTVLEEKHEIVKIVVQAAEQIFEVEEGHAKLEYAKERALDLASRYGLEFSEEELEDMIEGHVTNLRQGFAKGFNEEENIETLDAIEPEFAPDLIDDEDL